MELAEIVDRAKQLPADEWPSFFGNLKTLLFQFRNGVALRDPYRLLLDTSILIRLESYGHKQTDTRLLSVLAFFNYLEHFSSFKGDPLVTPAIFYEYSRKQGASNLNEHWTMSRDLKTSVKEALGREPLFEGTETYETAAPCIDALQYDEQSIAEYLRSLPEQEWSDQLSRLADTSQQQVPEGILSIGRSDGTSRTSPFFVAQNLYLDAESFCGQPVLHYLSPSGVAHFLISHIAWHISKSITEHPVVWIDRTLGNEEDYAPSKILYFDFDLGKLKGLGDVELLSVGNVQRQFKIQQSGRYHPASIPLALDGDLDKELWNMAGFGVESGNLGGGQDPETRQTNIERYLEGHEKMDDAECRIETCRQEQKAFTEELK